MEKIIFDFENVGGLSECYAIPASEFRRIRTDYARSLRYVEVNSRSGVVVIPMYADGSFQHTETKQRTDGGDCWEVDIEGIVPKLWKGSDRLMEVLERGEWLVLSRDNNGVVRLSGCDAVPLFLDTERTTGRGYTDLNGTTFHFKGIQPRPSLIIDMAELDEL